MHIVGARFEALDRAAAALAEIRARVAVPPGDVAVRPLGSTHYEEPARGYILAGRFDSSTIDVVVSIMDAHGGTVLERRLERPLRGAAWRPQQPVTSGSGALRRGESRTVPASRAKAFLTGPMRARARPTPPHDRTIGPRKRPRRPSAMRGRAAPGHRCSSPDEREAAAQ